MRILKFLLQGKSIRFKLLCYFLILILLPIASLGILGNIIYSNSMEQEANNHTIQMIDQVKKNIEFYIKDMDNIIYYISQDLNVQKIVREKNNLDKNYAAYEAEVKSILSTFTKVHPEIAGIMIVNKNDLYISNEMKKISRDRLIFESWYVQAATHPNSIQLISKPIGRNILTSIHYSADDVVSIAKAVIDPNTNECLGVILIDMKLEIIKKSIDDITLGKDGFLYIMDENGNVVYAPVNSTVYRVKYEWLNEKSNSLIKTIKNNRYQIIYKDSAYTKWKTIGVFSLNETLSQVSNIRNISMVIGGITLLLAIIAALFFTSSIARPLSKLRKLMKTAEEGDLNVQFKKKYNDEIGQLGDSFNNMIHEIRNLIDMVYKEQKSKREAELKTLQAQIKPHFLYNTLDTIQWMAQSHGANDIVEVIGALTALFRIGINRGKEMITIREELEHVRSYLIIQKVRYEDKLEYEISFEEEVLDCRVIKLILQPLVENAIYHGIKQKRGGGKITISVEKKDGKLYFCVTDNGIGIREEKILEIQKVLDDRKLEGSNFGFGIFNVSERIKLTFGTEYGLNYKSNYNEGTTVELWHPITEE